MTGFGKAMLENENCIITVEIKSLNSKFLELNVRLPKHLSDKELEARKIISDGVVRGKVNVFVEYETKSKTPKTNINADLLKGYYNELKDAAIAVGEPNVNVFTIALNMPEVVKHGMDNTDVVEDWKLMKNIILEAIADIDKFREDEGKSLKTALESYGKRIGTLMVEIEAEEEPRREQIKARIQSQLEELGPEYDRNRFEQELIYYLEKLDITEEKVRLKSHLDYFIEELNGAGSGKKLGFIAQEIGREINTLGSKANYASIQQKVVEMKDDLEKIKEQVLNLI